MRRDLARPSPSAAFLAALAFAFACALGLFGLAPGHGRRSAWADSAQVSMSVPTEVPCALLADVAVVGPSSSLEFDTYLSGASVSGAPGNLSFSIGVALEVPAGGTTSISWNFSKLDSVKNADILAEAAAGERDAGADGPREIPTA